VSGNDGKWYIYRVKEMIRYLEDNFGEPDVTVVNEPFQDKLKSKKGIIVFEVDAWNDASGHATLWDGITCADKCYFPLSKKVMLWELK
jgi:Type VI secretion system (T6SS), amidase effector protein 4